MSYKKYWLLLCLAACMSPAYADVLVILPESGTMARAGQSIKRGFLSAYTASGSKEKIITELFLVALMAEFGSDIAMVNQLPKKLSRKEGVLLLGDHQWMEQLGALPEKNIYATPLSIEQGQSIPLGLSFCDVSALYNGQWSDLIEAYKEQPENMAFQGLLAFGG